MDVSKAPAEDLSTSNNNDKGNKFYVDYYKRGTAKCRVCKKVTAKGEPRIGNSVPYKATNVVQYRHVECAFLAFRRARLLANVVSDVNNLDGINEIKDIDKKLLENIVEHENSIRTHLPESIISKKKTSASVTLPRRSSNLPAIPILFTNADQLTTAKMSELQARITPHYAKLSPRMRRNVILWKTTRYQGSIHSVNLECNDSGRGIAVYTHSSLDKSIVHTQPCSSDASIEVQPLPLHQTKTMRVLINSSAAYQKHLTPTHVWSVILITGT